MDDSYPYCISGRYGDAYVDVHQDEDGRRFYSANYFSGESGYQNGPYRTLREARAAVREIAVVEELRPPRRRCPKGRWQ